MAKDHETEGTESPTPQPKKFTRREIEAKISDLNREYRDLGIEARAGNGAAQGRQSEISRELFALSRMLYLREPEVEIVVTRSATGHPYVIADQTFPPGTYIVKKSIAQYLSWLMDRNKNAEVDRLKSNGATVALKAIGTEARMVDDGGRSF